MEQFGKAEDDQNEDIEHGGLKMPGGGGLPQRTNKPDDAHGVYE